MFQVISFLKYWLQAVDAHSLHSPFIYKFYTEVLKGLISPDDAIEGLRRQLQQNTETIELTDFGAGSRVTSSKKRTIKSLAKYASTPLKSSLLFEKVISFFEYKSVIELGTSLGINTLYLSKREGTKVYTFEGDPTLSAIAKSHFEKFNRTNIEQIQGNIDETLDPFLDSQKSIDFVYLDANHRFKPTLYYFELIFPKLKDGGVILVDDIHWSEEMWKAWIELKEHPEISVSIDIFEAGILFKNLPVDKQDYTLNF